VCLTAALTGCEEDLLADQPDAAVDAEPIPEGDFSCVDEPRFTTAPDPLPVSGQVMDWDGVPLAGASVSVHDATTDALIVQTTTSAGLMNKGRYAVQVPTGGQARAIYRKLEAPGQLDTYAYDAWPEFTELRFSVTMLDQANLDSFYQMAGMTPDPTKGVVWVQAVDCKRPLLDGYPPYVPDGTTTGAKSIAGATFEGPPGSRALYSDADGLIHAELTRRTRYGVVLSSSAFRRA
jgi:hypothetical protein